MASPKSGGGPCRAAATAGTAESDHKKHGDCHRRQIARAHDSPPRRPPANHHDAQIVALVAQPRQTDVVQARSEIVGVVVAATIAIGCTDTALQEQPEVASSQHPISSVASAECSDNQLRVSVAANQHALRAEVTYIRFTNTSSSNCWLQGFPRVRLLDQKLHALPTRTSRYRPAPPPRVTLEAHGGHADTNFSSFPANPGPNGSANRCPNTGGVRITAPGLTQTHTLKVSRRYCELGKITLYPVIQQPYGTVTPTPVP